ncbi:MAG: GAF domain-containing protein [Nitrospinae bacterium]|nr:GAF domain-containing protein [Nitrospinota bacterium]
MNLKFTTDSEKVIKSINSEGLSAFGYEENELLGKGIEKFFLEADGVASLFSESEEAQLRQRGYLMSLQKKFLSKGNKVVSVDLDVERNSEPSTDYVFRVQRKDENSNNEILLRLQNNALEKLAANKPLKEILDALTRGAEGEVRCAKASILILDNTGTRLLDGSTPSFSEEVRNAFNGMVIGPLEGSCGAAVYNQKLVIVEDIATDPKWEKFKDFALENGLRACASTPILGTDGKVLGSFALTFTESKAPTEFELEIIKTSARIAALAIEKKRSEENLQRYAEELSHSNRELKNFTFVASHDLKEPLRKIHLFAEQLIEMDLSQEKKEDYIKRIQKSSSRMYNLTDDLYNWASIGRREFVFKSEDLKEVVLEVIDDLEGSIQETGAKINIDSLPVLEMEKTQMRQLFQNLLSNAMKFQNEGITPEIKISSRCTGDGYCEIDIKDNGIGIDTKYYEKIFEPFSRLNNKENYPGSGIGLAICEKIILRHNGEIKVDSSPQTGTTITLRLPSQQ